MRLLLLSPPDLFFASSWRSSLGGRSTSRNYRSGEKESSSRGGLVVSL